MTKKYTERGLLEFGGAGYLIRCMEAWTWSVPTVFAKRGVLRLSVSDSPRPNMTGSSNLSPFTLDCKEKPKRHVHLNSTPQAVS